MIMMLSCTGRGRSGRTAILTYQCTRRTGIGNTVSNNTRLWIRLSSKKDQCVLEGKDHQISEMMEQKHFTSTIGYSPVGSAVTMISTNSFLIMISVQLLRQRY